MVTTTRTRTVERVVAKQSAPVPTTQLNNLNHLSSVSSVPSSSPRDFSWSETDEPHATRRRIILSAHPEINELFGPEPLTCPIVLALLVVQLLMAYTLRDASWGPLFLCAWAIGGTINHSLQLAVHEISHNLAFNSPTLNKLLAITGNLPTGVPSAISFQKYHMDHHQYQGVDGIDTDVPTQFEVDMFTNSALKVLWLFLQPLFYALRPALVKPKPIGKWDIFNLVACLAFDAAVYYFIGLKGLIYLFSGTLLGLGLHPSAGHFVAEHYEFVKGQETYSYYGPLNWVNFNVGYHNEHHDFPRIAWSRLPKVKEIAPEFYNNLPCYTSYLYVFYRYITDNEVGPFSRIKRNAPSSMKTISDNSSSSNGGSKNLFTVAAFLFLFSVVGFILYSAIFN